MKLLAQAFVNPDNTKQTAIGSLQLDGMRDIPIAIHLTTLEMGGRTHTGLLLEAYAGATFHDAFARLPQVENCDKALRVMLMLGMPQLIEGTLRPLVETVCRALSRPVPALVDSDYPAAPAAN